MATRILAAWSDFILLSDPARFTIDVQVLNGTGFWIPYCELQCLEFGCGLTY